MAITADDLVRFIDAGVKVEAEIQAAQAAAAAAALDAARYAKIRGASDARKLRIIMRLIQADTPAAFDNFIDNLGA